MKSSNKLMIALIFLGLVSCKKYEDGPLISLVPKAERVANTWIVEKAIADDKDVTEDYDQYELYLTKDGAAELTAKYKVFGSSVETHSKGTWQFTNDKQNIRMDYEDNSLDAEYIILKLTEKEFWLHEVGRDLELHLREK